MDKYGNGIDTIYQLPNGVMKNKLGITDAFKLEAIERDMSAIRAKQLAVSPIVGSFDLAHLQAIHRTLFGDIYDWAGEIRRVDISKGNTRFANFAFIESAASKLSQKLQSEHFLCQLSPCIFSEKAAYYLGEWNVIHPFREGTGRTLREFFNQLAKQNRLLINWKNISADQMIQACIAAYHADYQPLSQLIKHNLSELPNRNTE